MILTLPPYVMPVVVVPHLSILEQATWQLVSRSTRHLMGNFPPPWRAWVSQLSRKLRRFIVHKTSRTVTVPPGFEGLCSTPVASLLGRLSSDSPVWRGLGEILAQNKWFESSVEFIVLLVATGIVPRSRVATLVAAAPWTNEHLVVLSSGQNLLRALTTTAFDLAHFSNSYKAIAMRPYREEEEESVTPFRENPINVIARVTTALKGLFTVLMSGAAEANARIYRDAVASVSSHGLGLARLNADMRANPIVVLTAVENDGRALRYASEAQQRSRRAVLKAVRQHGPALEHAAPELKADREIVLAAVKQNGRSLEHAAPELKADWNFMLAAVKQNGRSLKHAAPELKADRDFVLAAVKQNGMSLEHAGPELKADRDFALAAVKQNGMSLKHAGPELKADWDIVLAAVEQNGMSLEHAAPELKADQDIVLTAVYQNGYSREHAAPELMADSEFVLRCKETEFCEPVLKRKRNPTP